MLESVLSIWVCYNHSSIDDITNTSIDADDAPAGGWNKGDWFFQGDAAEIIPRLLEPVTGEVGIPGTAQSWGNF